MIIIMGYSNLTPKAVENDQGMRQQVLLNIKLWNLLKMIVNLLLKYNQIIFCIFRVRDPEPRR